MTDQPSRVLLWSARALPMEIRGLLIGVIGLFGTAAIAVTMVSGHDWTSLVSAVAASLASVGLTLWLAWSYDTPRSAVVLTTVLLVAAVLLVTAFAVSAQPTTVLATGLPFAFAIAWHRPVWLPLLVGLVSIGIAAGIVPAVRVNGFPTQEAIIMTVLLGAATVGFSGAHVGWQLQRQLDQHDADQRDLAMTRERLRFATDLHDIQGHTLLAIKLKAELARRSISSQPETAREELRAIENLAAEADRSTRDLAQGYRILNLAAELANFEQLLTAAGIDVTIHRTGAPSRELDEIFAVLTREAASNILRHANATTVGIYLSDTTMVIDNDGALADNGETHHGGNGLIGLQRRFTESNGTFTSQRDGDLFTVTGEIGSRP